MGQYASPPGRNRTDDLWFFRPALSTKTELPGDKARTEGVEPSSSGSKPGMFSVTPRPHKAEREGFEPTVE